MSVSSACIVVIGLGNVFRRDDGLGPAVVTRLERRAGRDGRPPGSGSCAATGSRAG
ncbi:hypothetical protein [Streptomyces roseoverticillatus]|uniref:hypothetical protein n=1 Tax=Streptomyces roseoverticillatus TaxID=66429 RepID=UPI0027E4F46C|nr:hypothetical protein [Streptomyces roseoverticillatus]